jgi:hypothetical protein
MTEKCTVSTCTNGRARSSGGCLRRYCWTHYGRLQKSGDLYAEVPIGKGPQRALADRRAAIEVIGMTAEDT